MQKKEYTLRWRGEVLPGGAPGPGTARGTLGLFLLPTGRPGHRFTGVDDETPATADAASIFLLRGRPRPRCAIGKPRFRRDPPASAMETSFYKRETLDEEKEDDAVEEESN
jgi:hypothetical protein